MLREKYIFRIIRQDEAEQAAVIEHICFPPNEACSRQMMLARIATVPEQFLVAEDKETGKIAGFLTGIATNEDSFRDEFFSDANLHDSAGSNLMILGLNVLPEYRGQGLARELMREYCCRESENGRERMVLTCLPSKIKMYEKMGFRDDGISKSTWGGEQWHEMSCMIRPSASGERG